VITRKNVGVRSLTNNSLVWNISMPMSFCLEEKTGELEGENKYAMRILKSI
jgi:hypothetical protein